MNNPAWQFVGVLIGVLAFFVMIVSLFFNTPFHIPFRLKRVVAIVLAILIISMQILVVLSIVHILIPVSPYDQSIQRLGQIIIRTPTFNDPLNANINGIEWDENSTCIFKGGVYHVTSSGKSFVTCLSRLFVIRNFVFKVQMKVVQGNEGGFVFSANVGSSENDTYYYYIRVDNRTYGLLKHTQISGKRISQDNLLMQSFNSAINAGLFQTNELIIMISDGTFDLFINKQHVAHIVDATIGQGHPGLASGQNCNVVFTQANMWIF